MGATYDGCNNKLVSYYVLCPDIANTGVCGRVISFDVRHVRSGMCACDSVPQLSVVRDVKRSCARRVRARSAECGRGVAYLASPGAGDTHQQKYC